MDLRVWISILFFLVSIQSGLAYKGNADDPYPTDNVDLPDFYHDWGTPTKNCKDIWTLCGTWSTTQLWEKYTSVCCRSEGANKAIVCRYPSRYLKEFAAGPSNMHKTFCLPIEEKYTHWRSGGGGPGAMSQPPAGAGINNMRGDMGMLANQEIVEQLTRIADALDAKP